MVEFTLPQAALKPDHLLASAYDDSGVLWKKRSVPIQGNLAAHNSESLGTLLINPGALSGDLRMHFEALKGEGKVLEGLLRVTAAQVRSRGTFAVPLRPDPVSDTDTDGVPDLIDDCPTQANPEQQGCPTVSPADAAQRHPAQDATVAGPVSAQQPTGPDQKPDARLNPASAAPDAPSVLDGPLDTQAAATGHKLGEPCQNAGQCSSGFCAEGACCERSACPLCQSCALPSAPGQCMPRPRLAQEIRPAETFTDPGAPLSCTGTMACDGFGACKKVQGSACTAETQCISGFCVDGVCCGDACQGPCRACNSTGREGICQAYSAGTDPEKNCQGGTTCSGSGSCGAAPIGKRGNGQLCSQAIDCTSGFCKDGVCCTNACNETCESCATGMCLPIARQEDAPECAPPMWCNSQGKCRIKERD